MKRTGAGVLALLSALSASPAAHAQAADLTRATCAQLMDLPRNDRGQLIVWLHGYYAGAAQRAMLDRSKLEDSLTGLQQLCEGNRGLPLIGSEARSVLLGEGPPQPPAATTSQPGTFSGQPARP
jgi:hypothetical protein